MDNSSMTIYIMFKITNTHPEFVTVVLTKQEAEEMMFKNPLLIVKHFEVRE